VLVDVTGYCTTREHDCKSKNKKNTTDFFINC